MSAAHSHQARVQSAIDAVRGRSLPGTANMLSLAGIAWGAVGFLYGMTFSAPWTWGAVIVALVIGLGIAQGGVVFAGIQVGTQARWARPLKRIAESLGYALPVIYLLLAVFLFAGITVFPWHPHTITGEGPIPLAPHATEVPHAKELLLSPGMFQARLLLGVGFLIVLDLIFLRASLKPDLILAKRTLGKDAPAWWDRVTGGSDDLEGAIASGARTQENLIPLMAITFALVMSLVAFDLIMSLEPWWVSNMFGGWIFMSSLWMALNFTGATAMVYRDWLGLGGWVTTKTTHDLGRFMLAGCMFWAYTLYAQILPIWYTNVPEETNFLLIRLMLPQWNPMSKLVAVMCFVAPFTILLSRGIKKMRWPFVGLNVLIITGLFMERSLLVLPSVWFEATVPWANFVIVNIGLWAGMIGLIVQISGRALASMPAVPVSDEKLEEHPWDVHVHSLDGHAHAHH